MTFFNTFANFNITSFGFPPKINIGFNIGWSFNPFGGLGCLNNLGWNLNPFVNFGCFNKTSLYTYPDPMSLSCFNYYGTPYNEPPSMYDTFNSSNAFDYTKINQSYQPWNMATMPSLNSNMQYDWSNQIKQLKIIVPDKKKEEKEIEFTGDLKDYNAENGSKLSEVALKNSVGWTQQCATYVKNAIKEAGLGEYIQGDAHEMDTILASNNNFKKINPEDINITDLPAGCVLVYEKGVGGYHEEYGHVEITTGDGRGVSDGITNNLNKKPSHIFIPV